MTARPNLMVRLLARLLRPVVFEVLDMGGRDAPLPWQPRRRDCIPVEGGGALFDGRFGGLPQVTQRYLTGLGFRLPTPPISAADRYPEAVLPVIQGVIRSALREGISFEQARRRLASAIRALLASPREPRQ